MGIDPSLTSTGIAVCHSGDEVVTHRIQSKGKKTDTWYQRHDRLTLLEIAIFDKVPHGSVVMIEGPSYGSVGGSQFDRAGLWRSTFKDLRIFLGCEVIPVSPAQRTIYACGSARATKDQVLAAAVKRYPWIDITGNDVADAVLFLAIGKRLLGEPIDGQLPVSHLRAMDKIERPT